MPTWSALLVRGHAALAVLPLLTIWTLVLYWRVRGGRVISDGWVLLEIGAQGLARAPFTLLGYHTIPVTNLLSALLWKLCGLREGWYQLINLLELGLVGWCLYIFGAGHFGRWRALLASLVFLAHPAFYEVPLWPVVGNFQSLAALLSLGAVAAAWQSGSGPHRRRAAGLYFGCSLLAFFTYEPTVALLPVGVAGAVLSADTAGPWRPRLRACFRKAGPTLWATALLSAIVIGSKLWTHSQGHRAAFLPNTLWDLGYRAFMLVRGALAIFGVAGSDSVLYPMITFGLGASLDHLATRLAVVAWLLIGTALLGMVLWRGRPATRLLAVWLTAQLGICDLATPIVSRHFYIAAIPGCLLLVLATEWLSTRAGQLWRRSTGATPGEAPRAATLLIGISLALLVARGQADLVAAQNVYLEASQASRQVREQLTRHFAPHNPDARALLVDLPASIGRDGVAIMPFVNGVQSMTRLTTGVGEEGLSLAAVGGPFVDGRIANGSVALGIPALWTRIDDPSWLVLAWDPAEREIRRLDADTFAVPTHYTPSAMPFLLWRRDGLLGEWTFTVEGPLDLPLATPGCGWGSGGDDCRIRVAFLAEPGSGGEVRVGAARVDASDAGLQTPEWRTINLPPSGDPTTWLHLEPSRAQPLRVRRLEVVRQASSDPSR